MKIKITDVLLDKIQEIMGNLGDTNKERIIMIFAYILSFLATIVMVLFIGIGIITVVSDLFFSQESRCLEYSYSYQGRYCEEYE